MKEAAIAGLRQNRLRQIGLRQIGLRQIIRLR